MDVSTLSIGCVDVLIEYDKINALFAQGLGNLAKV